MIVPFAYVSLRLLGEGAKTGLGSAFSFWRICESLEGPSDGPGTTDGGRSWEEEPEVDAIGFGLWTRSGVTTVHHGRTGIFGRETLAAEHGWEQVRMRFRSGVQT